ncbi:NACHT and WD domain-containing protein [Histoplasma ohiense]|nr:NACHT and WD domain-containing protein [Histoplasma ohiense (nom. inval.)]
MKSLRRNLKSLQKPFVNGSSTLSPSATLIHEDGDREHVDEHGDPDGGDDDDWKGPIGLNLLHEPENPRVDLIFVHGLGGGSRKTWSLTKEMKHFWPKSWLPEDSAFENVRIYSFGYSSDWHKGKDSAMNIYDYGLSLLTAMELRPGFGADDTPIVLIGHSMGGLVIKKAYMLARLNPQYDDIAKRISTFYFIATPHLGSDSAELLTKIFHAAYGSRSYVSDLERGSSTIRDINGQFRLYAGDLKLWSFYETLPLTVGFLSKIIVRQDFAVLGYGSEKQIPMTADHRSICKFNSVADPNYRNIRDALALTVRELTGSGQRLKAKRKYEQMKTLREYLGVASTPKEDLTIVQEARLSGTCEWLSSTASYIQWRNNPSSGPAIFWLGGNPGAGKSVLAGYAIEMLEAMGAEVSYFFFKFGDESKSKLNTCLRSIAFQMASRNESLKELLLSMHSDGIEFDKGDERTIWRKIFLSGIFQAPIPPQYWVIDALDECTDFVSFFGPMLAKLDNSIPIHILITSRPTAILQQQFYGLGTGRVVCEQISAADTLHDVRIFVEEKSMLLDVEPNDRDSLVERILAKSNDSFLWTAIVLSELLNVHGQEDINRVLEEVPQEMEPLYSRILETMSRAKHGKKLAQAILAWSICAQRPLTVPELESALNLDLSDTFLHFRRSIKDTCGQLVSIDGFGRVQIVHATAREFLVKNGLQSEFAINVEETHTRIAKTCLLYLTGPEMEPPPPRMRTSASLARKIRSEFAVYAIHSFSDHLAYSSPTADDVLDLLDTFLSKNILSWIQAVAENQDLRPMFIVSKNFRTYLDNLLRARPLEERRRQAIRGWSKDLIRVTTKFGDAMLSSPSAIRQIILPFFPKRSTVYETFTLGGKLTSAGSPIAMETLAQRPRKDKKESLVSAWTSEQADFTVKFVDVILRIIWAICRYIFPSHIQESTLPEGKTATRGRGLSVVGNSNDKWDDLLCYIRFKDSRGRVFSHGDSCFAIGFMSGLIILYDGTTYQQFRVLDNGGHPNHIVFKSGTDLMASSTYSDIGYEVKLWDIRDAQILLNFKCDCHPVWLGFRQNELIVVYRNNSISFWDVIHGCRRASHLLSSPEQIELADEPSTAAISPDGNILAIGYSGNRPITLWNLEERKYHGNCGVGSVNGGIKGVRHLLFGPSAKSMWLLVCYDTSDRNSELKVIEPFSDYTLRQLHRLGHINALAVSPDERTLLMTGPDVWVFVYDFETLEMQTFLKTDICENLSVAWGNDSFHFFEFCDFYCVVWEPDMLVPSYTKDATTEAQVIPSAKPSAAKKDVAIRSMEIDSTGHFAFCGTNDGTVLSFNLETGAKMEPFYKAGDSLVSALGWWADGEILTALHATGSPSGWLSSAKLKKTPQWETDGWQAEKDSGFFIELSDDTFTDSPQLLTSPYGKSLVATRKRSYLISVDGQIQASKNLGPVQWIQHPFSPLYVIGVEYLSGGRSTINIHNWSELTLLACVHLDVNISPGFLCDGNFYHISGNNMLVISRQRGHGFHFDWTFLKVENSLDEVPVPPIAPLALAEVISFVLGIWQSRLIFCNREWWVCSVELEHLDGPYQRHFFIPEDWVEEDNTRYAMTKKGDIVVDRKNELAVIKGGLNYVDRVEFAPSSRASSTTCVESPTIGI